MQDEEFLGQRITVWAAMIIALVVKYLWSGQDETLANLTPAARRKRELFGIAAGLLCGYFGSDTVLRLVDRLAEDDRTMIVILLTLTGEHFVRAVMTITPDTIRGWIVTKVGGSK